MISTCLNDVKHNKKNLSLEISKELYKIGVSNKVKDHFYYTRNLIFTEDIAAQEKFIKLNTKMKFRTKKIPTFRIF